MSAYGCSVQSRTFVNFASQGEPLSGPAGGAQEVGSRHRNWRELWSNVVGQCPGHINDIELMQSVLCLALPDNANNGEIAKLVIEKHGSFANAISAPLSDHHYAKAFPPVAGVALKVILLAARRLVKGEKANRSFRENRKGLKNI